MGKGGDGKNLDDWMIRMDGWQKYGWVDEWMGKNMDDSMIRMDLYRGIA